MANLKVSIVVRTKGPDGKRGWVPATGKNDPVGPLYLRYYKGSSPKHIKAGRFYDEAEVAKLRLERTLRASNMGIELPQEYEKGTNFHHWRDCLNSYLTLLRGKTKRNGWRYKNKSVREREANILEFARLIAKPFVENYSTAYMLTYKEHLYSLGRANDTVLNKLSCIVTWLKRNGLVSIVGLLPADERPERRETEGHPLSETEVDKVMGLAGEHKLLLRLAYNAGMRKMEYAHVERADIDPINKTIRIRPKPKYGWTPKTRRGVRFFNQNLVMEYNFEQAVADGVNVDFDLYTIRTLISEHGSTINAGYYVDFRDRETRRVRFAKADQDIPYDSNELDRRVVAKDQIRTIIRTFKDRLFTEIFPGRTDVPKTLIILKTVTSAKRLNASSPSLTKTFSSATRQIWTSSG